MAVEQGISIEKNEIFSRRYIAKKILKIGAILAVLYLISIKDYLLFHAIIEFIVAAVAVSIFLLAWNSRKFSGSGFYVFIGSAFPGFGHDHNSACVGLQRNGCHTRSGEKFQSCYAIVAGQSISFGRQLCSCSFFHKQKTKSACQAVLFCGVFLSDHSFYFLVEKLSDSLY